jgi:hypothetical protein
MNDQSVPGPVDTAKKDGVWVKRADGSWAELPSQPVNDDPVAEVGKLGRDEFEAILADKAHPDHAAAVTWKWMLTDRARWDLLMAGGANSPHLAPTTLAAMFRFAETARSAVKRNQLMDPGPPQLPADIDQLNQVNAALERAARSFSRVRQILQPTAPLLNANFMARGRIVKKVGDQFIDLTEEEDDGEASARRSDPEIVGLLLAGAVELPTPSQTEPPQQVNARLQEQTNELLQVAVEIMSSFAEGQEQLLELERARADAAENREKIAQAEATASRRRERHQNVGMWIGIAVGVVGAVAALLAL